MNRKLRSASLERELKRLRDLLAAELAAAEKNVGRRQQTAQRRIAELETQIKRLEKELSKLEKRAVEAEGLFEAAKSRAIKAGAKLGIIFVPGKTKLEDIEEKVKPTPEQAALEIEPRLPFGIGYKSTFLTVLGWILLIPCAILIFFEFGLLFGGIVFGGGGSVRLHALPLVGALAVALLISIGVQSSLRRIWREVGASVAIGQSSTSDFLWPIIVAIIIAASGTALDAYVVHQLAAADADTAISWPVSIMIGFLISGIYALSAIGAAFMYGYHPTALSRVEAHRDDVWENALQNDLDVVNAVESFAACDEAQTEHNDVVQMVDKAEIKLAEAHEAIRDVHVPIQDAEDFTVEEKAKIKEIKDQIELVEIQIDALLAAMFGGGEEAEGA